MAIEIAFAPLASILALLIASATIAVFTAMALYWRAWGTFWRVIPLGLLLLALAAPYLKEERRTPLEDIVILISDHTPSQELPERELQREQAMNHLRDQIERLDNIETRILTVEEDSRGGTRLFSALQEALEGLPRERLAGVVMVTDGQVHDIPEPADADLSMPFHVLLTGKPDEIDRTLRIEHSPGFGLVGESVETLLRIEDFPQNEGKNAHLSLRLDGIERETIAVQSDETIPLQIPLLHAGANILEAEVTPLAGETFLDNNRIVLEVQGIRERLRVLLVSGRPHPGMRVWRWLLKGDAAVDLVHFTVLRDPSQSDDIPNSELSLIPFPARELFLDRLDEFDLVIFDNYRLRGILPQDYFDNIVRYIFDGGALLVASGQDFATRNGLYNSPLSEVLPLRPTGGLLERQYVPRIEGAGLRHPVTADLANAGGSWGGWFRLVEGEVIDGDVLMTGLGGRPLLGLQRVGKGRVAQLMSDHIWLWARGFSDGGPHADLLRALAHWLMREPELEEERLWGEVEEDILTVWRAGMGNTVSHVEVTSASGEVRKVELEEVGLGRWRGRLELGEDLSGEAIRLRGDGLETLLAVEGGSGLEKDEVQARADLLEPVVEANGGFSGWIDSELPRVLRVDADALPSGAGWLGLRENGNYVVGSVDRVSLLRGVFAVLAMFSALAWCWWREAR